jgi:hypothetical protein
VTEAENGCEDREEGGESSKISARARASFFVGESSRPPTKCVNLCVRAPFPVTVFRAVQTRSLILFHCAFSSVKVLAHASASRTVLSAPFCFPPSRARWAALPRRLRALLRCIAQGAQGFGRGSPICDVAPSSSAGICAVGPRSRLERRNRICRAARAPRRATSRPQLSRLSYLPCNGSATSVIVGICATHRSLSALRPRIPVLPLTRSALHICPPRPPSDPHPIFTPPCSIPPPRKQPVPKSPSKAKASSGSVETTIRQPFAAM